MKKPTPQMMKYTAMAAVMRCTACIRRDRRLNRREQGTATNWVTSSARIMPVEPNPSVAP